MAIDHPDPISRVLCHWRSSLKFPTDLHLTCFVEMDLRFIAATLAQSNMVLIDNGKIEVINNAASTSLSELEALCCARDVTYLPASAPFLKGIGIKTNAIVVCDEDGLCRHGVNTLATKLLGDGIWEGRTARFLTEEGTICGPVIVLGYEDLMAIRF